MYRPFRLARRVDLLQIIGILVSAAIVATSGTAIAQDKLLWGSLKPGSFTVGFQSCYQFDYTRDYDPEIATDHLRLPARRPRPILVCIWYPCQSTNNKPFAYRNYLDLPANEPKANLFNQRLTPFVRDVVCEETIGKKPKIATAAEAAAFERFLNTKTFAIKEAPAADGRFPVIIYHPGLGGTFEDNSVLFEYLASHGYVVLSSAYPAADASIMNINWDLARSFRDMEFLTHFAQRLPFADVEHLAAMGHSYGAQAALAWDTESNSALRAVVSIDSTTENLGRDHPGFAKFYRHFVEGKLNFRAPTLRFASRENKPKFDNLEPYIKFAPRYEAAVANLEHNDYLTHGAVRPALLPEKWPDTKKAQALRRSYDRVCEHIVQFFDAYLKQSNAAQAFLAKSLRGEGFDQEFALKFKSPVVAPPSARQLLLILQKQGAAQAAELLRTCRDDVDKNRLFDGLRFSLIDFDNQVIVNSELMQEALKLFNLSEQIFPKSAALQLHFGKAREVTGDRDGAIAAYRRGLELVTSGGGDEKEMAPSKSDFEANLKRLGWDNTRRNDK